MAAGRDETTYLRDPRAIRALAHPARMAIIDALATGDELTATECAALTGLSPSATAYHLKLLERYAFAEPAPARSDGRERPWRASRRAQFELDASTAAGAAAAAAVALAYLDRSRAVGAAFMAGAHDEPAEWQDAAALGNADLWLTADELRHLTAELGAALEPYRSRTRADRPEGSRRVRVTTMAVPHPRR
ncbi:MAG TPA: winged helix-turn-helix domain-containing protein [Gaiellaceae bacterium]|nr:winged helix-turn-helix domain-containing protein [Gaiellaceae bacterium]